MYIITVCGLYNFTLLAGKNILFPTNTKFDCIEIIYLRVSKKKKNERN